MYGSGLTGAAKLRQLSDAANPQTRTFEARYVLEGHLADDAVRAHRAASLAIDLRQPRQVLVLTLGGSAALFRSYAPEMAETLLQAFRQQVLSRLNRALTELGEPWPVVSQAEQWLAADAARPRSRAGALLVIGLWLIAALVLLRWWLQNPAA